MRFPLPTAAPLALLLAVLPFLSPAMAEEAERYRHGMNLSHWLQYSGRQPVGEADMRAIAAAGFDHVRIPFDPGFLGWIPGGATAPSPMSRPALSRPSLPMPGIKRLEDGVDMALAAGLAVIVDCHPDAEIKAAIEDDAGTRRAFIGLWSWLAARLADRPPQRVAFEILNEPQYYQHAASAWNELQQMAVRAIRGSGARNRILVTGIHGSNIAALDRIEPVQDPDVAYVFHFYDPQLLTHLGADWEPYPQRAEGMMRGLVYPASAMTFSKVQLRPGADISVVTRAVGQYLDADWDAETVRARIDTARQWAESRHVRLQATEFGALRGTSDPESRALWLADVRKSLDAAGIGWSVWDYADMFGVAETTGAVERLDNGTAIARDGARIGRRFDRTVLRALGLGRAGEE